MVSESLAGLFRSLRIYHGRPEQTDRMDALYRQFLRPGDLAFDIGSHVGDRISSFRRLGTEVVALEPQPLAFRALRLIHGRDRHVHLLQTACGAKQGTVELHVNSANPTVSTTSADFTKAADGADGWRGQVWDQVIKVPITTLDTLIAQFGTPQFTKIDVEGFEADVLEGLSRPLPRLSFEFTTIQREVAYLCLDRLADVGGYRYNVALGESQHLEFPAPLSSAEIRRYLGELPHSANSGDVYAIRDEVH
ncbi:MAG: FkbM family methyltransferase [Hyphomicrobiaceae bacterium]